MTLTKLVILSNVKKRKRKSSKSKKMTETIRGCVDLFQTKKVNSELIASDFFCQMFRNKK